jgi:hypothetical protein
LERLAAIARRAAREGPFEISREMLAAAAAPSDDVRGILAAIGFPLDEKGRHGAAPARGRAPA